MIVELFENGVSSSVNEFGAEQVILVRDEKTKSDLLRRICKRALVLTVAEAKGMEFTDCLVYNFFKSSPIPSRMWRVLYDYIDGNEPHATFDSMKHTSLCVELKVLYVLLTRARQNVVIFDDDMAKHKPLLDHWISQELITHRLFDDDIREIFVQASTPAEWRERGASFFGRKQYANARLCFEKAKDEHNERIAYGAELFQLAEVESATNVSAAKSLYLDASLVYENLPGFDLNVALCQYSAGNKAKAGKIYFECKKYRDAAKCFEEIKQWNDAAEAHEMEGNIHAAKECFYKLKDFEGALNLIQRNPRPLGDQHSFLFQEVAKKGAVHYEAKGNTDVMLTFIERFISTDLKKKFLKQHGHHKHLISILVADGCNLEAAQLYERQLSFESAATHYELADNNADAVRCSLTNLRHLFLSVYAESAIQTVSDEDLEAMFNRVESLMESVQVGDETRLEFNFLRFVADEHDGHDTFLKYYADMTAVGAQQSCIGLHIQLKTLQVLHAAQSSWTDICALTSKLHEVIISWIQVLRKLEKVVEFSLLNARDKNVFRECVNFFELTADGDGLSKSTHLVGNKIVAEIFGRQMESSSTVKLGFHDFAVTTGRYLHGVYFSAAEDCSRLLAEYKRPFADMSCVESLEMSLISYALNADSNCCIKEEYLTQKKRNERRASATKAMEGVISVVQPDCVYSVDMKFVQTARRDPRVIAIARNRYKDICSDSGLKYNAIATALLSSEITFNQKVVALSLERSMNEALSDVLANESSVHADYRTKLIRAFKWEENVRSTYVDEVSNDGSEVCEDPLLYSIKVGMEAIFGDLYWGEIDRIVFRQENRRQGNKSSQHTPALGCFSPECFIKLTEKYYVLLQVLMKCGINVLLPEALSRDVLCRENKAYVLMVGRLRDSVTLDKQSNDAKLIAKNKLNEMVGWLLETLEQLNDRRFTKWEQSVSSKSFGMDDFVTRTLIICTSFILNISGKPKEMWLKKLIFAASRHEKVVKREFWQGFNGFKLTSKKFVPVAARCFENFFKSPIKCLHLFHNCGAVPSWASKCDVKRAVLDVTDDGLALDIVDRDATKKNLTDVERNREVIIDDGMDNDVDTGSEFNESKPSCSDSIDAPLQSYQDVIGAECVEFLLIFFRKVSDVLKKRRRQTSSTSLNLMRSMIEKNFFEVNLDQSVWWLVEHCLEVMCPLQLRLKELDLAIEKKVKKAQVSCPWLKVDYLKATFIMSFRAFFGWLKKGMLRCLSKKQFMKLSMIWL